MTKQQFEHTANFILCIICVIGIVAVIVFGYLLIRYTHCPMCEEKDWNTLIGK